MRPRLKSYVHFAPTEEGILFKGWDKPYFIKGPQWYTLMERLAPLLDGTRDLEEIASAAPEPVAQAIRKLIPELAQRGLVKDVSGDKLHGLTAEEQALYASTLAFLEDHTNDAGFRFERFRTSTLLLVGAGTSLRTAARCLLTSGLKHLHVAFTRDDKSESGLRNDVHQHQQMDPSATWTTLTLPESLSPVSLGLFLAPYESVCYVCDDPNPEFVSALNAACRAEGKRFLPGTIVAGHGAVGPLSGPDSSTCWECLLLHAGRDAVVHTDDASPVLLTLTGNMTAFEMIKHLTGVPQPNSTDGVVTIAPYDLETVRRPLQPAWACPCHAQHAVEPGWMAQVSHFSSDPAPSTFLPAIERLLDPVVGPLRHIGPSNLLQIPLALEEGEYATPDGLATVIGAGTDAQQARYSAARLALEAYTAARLPDDHLWQMASVISGKPVARAQQAHVASGHTYAEWLGRGVLQSLLTATPLQFIRPIVPAQLPTAEVRYWFRLLTGRYGLDVTVHLVPLLGIELGAGAMVTAGDQTLALKAGRTAEEALHGALLQAAAVVQAHSPRQVREISLSRAGPTRPVGDFFQTSGWDDWLATALPAITRSGREVAALPWDANLNLQTAGLLVGPVAVL